VYHNLYFIKSKQTMKKINLKNTVLIGAMLLGTTAIAQTTHKKTAYVDHGNNIYTYSTTNGILKEYIKTDWDGTDYEVKTVNGKITELYVDDKKIAPSDYEKYATVVAAIRRQIKEDRIQAQKDQQQAERDRAQAKRDQEQARRDQEQAGKEQVQAQRDQEQAKRDQEQAVRDQEQAKRDQEQAQRDQEDAKRDQEQAQRDQVQAKHDQEEAAEDQRQLKLMVSDLISDGILSNEKALHSLRMNADEMIVNGKKMPGTVFNKYKQKYPRFANGHSKDGNFNGMNIEQ
jgi:colicin import membrane protein